MNFGAKAATLAALVFLLASCNLFDPLDSPSGDEQLLSAARACFDVGDFDCAKKYYLELETTTYADIALAEGAFVLLDQSGAGMGNFYFAFAKPDGGKSLTKLATKLIQGGHGTSDDRARMYEAFRQNLKITDGSPTQGFVQFVSAVSLAAQLLAEDAKALGLTEVTQAVVASDATACLAAVCALSPVSCQVPGGMASGGATTFDFNSGGQTTLTETRTLQMLNEAIAEIKAGLDKMNASGSFGSLGDFASGFSGAAIVATPNGECYRQQMVNQGIGVSE